VGECTFAIVGEAPDEDEAINMSGFSGSSNRMLKHTCVELGLDPAKALLTNVFRHKPPQTAKKPNDSAYYFMKRTEAKRTKKETGWESSFPIKHLDGFLRPEYEDELRSLYAEIEKADPDIVIALGAYALWALTGNDSINSYRGTVIPITLPSGYKCKMLATYLPNNVVRVWSNRFHFVNDLNKAKGEIGSKTVERVPREVMIDPDLDDIYGWMRHHVWDKPTPPLLAVDIETDAKLRQITCVGFSVDDTHAIVIPFVDKTKANWSYWSDSDEELFAWRIIEETLENSDIAKVFQNGTYDMFWFMFQMKIPTLGRIEDTMHMHHALEPELPKGLDSLASSYLNEIAWKTLVSFKENKRGN
tara:strand:- start:6385 stop:7464 length:1080 start_codon:yes stop_codon:yes gene_type:complete